MSFATVWTKVYSIVNGLVASTDLEYTYNYGKKIGDQGYPFATVTPANSKEDPYSSDTDNMEITYEVAIYVRNDTIATAEWVLRWIVDALLVGLRSDYTLTGSALSARFEVEWWYTNDEQPLRVAIIKCIYLVCVTI